MTLNESLCDAMTGAQYSDAISKISSAEFCDACEISTVIPSSKHLIVVAFPNFVSPASVSYEPPIHVLPPHSGVTILTPRLNRASSLDISPFSSLASSTERMYTDLSVRSSASRENGILFLD